MNELLICRAKRITDNQWVYGYYSQIAGQHKILEYNPNSPSGATYYEVDPKTVCRNTGVKDKYGKQIYEGDIVEYFVGYAGSPHHKIGNATNVIRWQSKYACFTLLDNADIYEIIVLSNIYDHPDFEI